ncbi:MAG: hypothetical protein JXA77_07325 [Bacteroidales bacterium]|nr:hypothetical protein [Bacteroidales bacterium]MBN2819687.1 hypothetical protein [Bacteroidales bacterium]
MTSKLQELTQKIYQEGLEKGNSEAQEIIDKAKKEAQTVLETAKKEAEIIISEARKNAEETKINTKAEIKLSSKQALNALKQQITDIINSEVVGQTISKTFDANFTKNIVDTTLKNWAGAQTADIAILLPEKDEKELYDYFKKSIKDLLDKGLEIKFDAALNAGFQVTPKDGSYKLSFTDEDFANFFKHYLRPKLVEILFQD